MESPSSYDEILKFIVYRSRENNQPVADALVSYILNMQFDEGKNNYNI
jgi:hypothetical protein